MQRFRGGLACQSESERESERARERPRARARERESCFIEVLHSVSKDLDGSLEKDRGALEREEHQIVLHLECAQAGDRHLQRLLWGVGFRV